MLLKLCRLVLRRTQQAAGRLDIFAAVGALFDGMSRVKKQQTVYAPLMEHIASNAIHALSIKAFTPDEWKREKKFILPS